MGSREGGREVKKKIVALTMGLGMLLSATIPTIAATTEIRFPDLRTAEGTYYDYLVVETADGNEWLLGDEPDSKYLDNNGNAIFHDEESVVVLFDTMGTEDITDDIVLDVHKK